ncbi:hypothetical protein V5O48_017342 [Marasmius crinis-equi]|uniref:Glycosyltransferase family 15 protein n=1 Tax=Marasmius crinis-equi TaxID=585013 RepID=A0ABR3EP98_9AGAR
MLSFSRYVKYGFIILVVLVSLSFLYILDQEASDLKRWFPNGQQKTPTTPIAEDSDKRLANATFVILARNSEVDGVARSIQNIEDRFNAGRYPYVLLNDEPFTEQFKKWVKFCSLLEANLIVMPVRRISVLTPALVEFGVIPKEHWNQPPWIDEEKASKAREGMKAQKIKYGDNVQYRNMCRFNSGFFFKHDLLKKYKWYWRIEPNVKFHCDIKMDPFLFMEQNDKVYSQRPTSGFTIAVYEIAGTIPSLWRNVREFMEQHPEYVAENNSMPFLSNNHGTTYNLFWSNFEIADMDFWRGPAYTAFFEHLDSKGGFYYERWGDAPVHSIAAGLFLRRDQIHFFEDIGYQHDDWSHCPLRDDLWEKGRCACDQGNSFDYDPWSSCKKHWDRLMELGH